MKKTDVIIILASLIVMTLLFRERIIEFLRHIQFFMEYRG